MNIYYIIISTIISKIEILFQLKALITNFFLLRLKLLRLLWGLVAPNSHGQIGEQVGKT